MSQPDLSPHLVQVWEAFHNLTTERQLGALGGCGPIPWSSIERYARRYGIEELDEFEWFARLIRAVDTAYLVHVASKKPDKGKS